MLRRVIFIAFLVSSLVVFCYSGPVGTISRVVANAISHPTKTTALTTATTAVRAKLDCKFFCTNGWNHQKQTWRKKCKNIKNPELRNHCKSCRKTYCNRFTFLG